MDAAPQGPRGADSELDRIIADFLEARDRGEGASFADLISRHPEFATDLDAFFEDEKRWSLLARELEAPAPEPLRASELGAIGAYEILGEIARGGMGVVYKARHTRLGRTVALKMISNGSLARDRDVRRFHQEMRAVASVEHRHIVPIYEVGEHDGLPFFTMKYVDGGPLNAHLERFSSDPRTVAMLVEKIARAVHSAHRCGILHRDLKPANVLIDEDGEPQITDFGLAKELGEESGLTRSRVAVGTPAYMSPEQASGSRGDVGVAADVYSVGAILYELLTGRPPFTGETSLGILQKVLDEEPKSPRAWNRAVPRDLETICLKCLEKKPYRRYGTAEELAQELRRFLGGRPIHARRLTSLGRTWRWCRRNPAAVAVGVVLFASVIVSTSFYLGERRQRDLAVSIQRAERIQREAAESMTDFLLNPALAGGDMSVREVLASAEERVEVELAQKPAVQAAMHASIGEAYAGLSEFANAARHHRSAHRLYGGLGVEFEPAAAASLQALAFCLACSGDADEAIELLEVELEHVEAARGNDDPELARLLDTLSEVHLERGDGPAAAAAIAKAIELRRRLYGDSSADVGRGLAKLGSYLFLTDDDEAAIARLQEAVDLLSAALGPDDTEVAWTLHMMGYGHTRLGNEEEAEKAYLEARRIQLEVLGEESLEAAINLSHLAALKKAKGEYEEAESMLFEALRIKRAIFGEEHVHVANTLESIGKFYDTIDDTALAEEYLREALEMRIRFRKRDHAEVDLGHVLLGDLLLKLDRRAEAFEHHRSAFQIRRRLHGAASETVTRTRGTLEAMYPEVEPERWDE